MFTALCIWLAFINVVTFASFAADKRAAIRGEWRVSESTLLGLALLGGIVGAALGQAILRHKTRNQPFRTHLHMIMGLALAFFGLLAIYIS